MASKPNVSRAFLIFCVAAALVGAIFRLSALPSKIVWFDEIATLQLCSGRFQNEFQKHLLGAPKTAGQAVEAALSDSGKGPRDVVRVLVKEDQNHTPPFYVMTSLWMSAFGRTVTHLRLVAAFFGIAAIGATFMAARAMGGTAAGLIAMTLVALSPGHLAMAQEAREYSLWTAATLLWTAAFVRAVERDDRRSWLLYAGAGVLALWSHPLSLVILVGQTVAVSLAEPRRLKRFAWAAGGSLLLFSPWIVVYLLNFKHAIQTNNWTWGSKGWGWWSQMVFEALSHPFVDVKGYRPPAGVHILRVLLVVPAVAVTVAVFRRASKSARLGLASLLSITVAFALADLFFGGKRATVSRYIIPTWLCLQIALSMALSRLEGGRFTAAFTPYALAGFLSCVLFLKADWWWTKAYNQNNTPMAEVIGDSIRPVLVTSVPPWTNPYSVTSLAFRLPPEVPIVPAWDKKPPSIAPDDSAFFFDADPWLAEWAETQGQVDIPVYKLKRLTRIPR